MGFLYGEELEAGAAVPPQRDPLARKGCVWKGSAPSCPILSGPYVPVGYISTRRIHMYPWVLVVIYKPACNLFKSKMVGHTRVQPSVETGKHSLFTVTIKGRWSSLSLAALVKLVI